MAKRGRNYLEAREKVDRTKLYSPREALELVKETSFVEFDASVDVHLRLGVDPRHADQQVRGTVVLPNGLGKQVTVLVFATGEAARIAEEAGADYVASDDEMFEKIQGGWTEFDVALAVPDMMGRVGRLGRILGPRGLMPNPKAGTMAPADELPRLIEESKAGRLEFRLDKTANLHVPIGKVSFSADDLLENFKALMGAIDRPAGISAGQFIRRATVTSTMGPGIKMDPFQVLELI